MNKQLLIVIIGVLVLALAAVPLSYVVSNARQPAEDVFADTGAVEVYAAAAVSPTAAAAISAPEVEPTAPESGYIVREHDGEIAVFIAGDSEPGLMTGIPVSILRSTDRAALQEGIHADSVDDVAALIEDLGS